MLIIFWKLKAVSNEISLTVNQPFVSIKITPNNGVTNVMVEINGCFITGIIFFLFIKIYYLFLIKIFKNKY